MADEPPENESRAPAKTDARREPTRDEIARLAFELSLVHDRSDEENWLEAERELRGE